MVAANFTQFLPNTISGHAHSHHTFQRRPRRPVSQSLAASNLGRNSQDRPSDETTETLLDCSKPPVDVLVVGHHERIKKEPRERPSAMRCEILDPKKATLNTAAGLRPPTPCARPSGASGPQPISAAAEPIRQERLTSDPSQATPPFLAKRPSSLPAAVRAIAATGPPAMSAPCPPPRLSHSSPERGPQKEASSLPLAGLAHQLYARALPCDSLPPGLSIAPSRSFRPPTFFCKPRLLASILPTWLAHVLDDAR